MHDSPTKTPESADSADNLRAFAHAIMAAYPDRALDNATLRDIALRHGLLIAERRTAACGAFQDCRCARHLADFEMADGFTCDRKTDCLRAAQTSRTHTTPEELGCR